jgi:hypothetical protein
MPDPLADVATNIDSRLRELSPHVTEYARLEEARGPGRHRCGISECPPAVFALAVDDHALPDQVSPERVPDGGLEASRSGQLVAAVDDASWHGREP